MPDAPLVVIVGPTASGKTSLSLHLAQRFAGEIVNCDSVAVYREFEIGTAKPSRAERALVPHHLIDMVSPDERFTAGDYARVARPLVAEIADRRKLPIVVGGTGLYLRALLEGLFAGPPRSDELRVRLRDRGSRRGPGYLHRVLRRLDRTASESIHPNDDAKLIRAIEVSLLARQPMTRLWKQGRDPLQGFRILRIGLDPDRAALYDRINARCKAMFDQGLVNETRGLLARYGSDARAWALGSLGYRQAAEFLSGTMTLDAATQSAQQGHRNYAKRQMTWFRREVGVRWIHTFGDTDAARSEAEELTHAFLS